MKVVEIFGNDTMSMVEREFQPVEFDGLRKFDSNFIEFEAKDEYCREVAGYTSHARHA